MTSDPAEPGAGRFHSAARHYLAGRPPYPAELIWRVARDLDLRPTDRLMDLGCGPAQLAAAFAPWVEAVVALDPEPAMLALAREAARAEPRIEVVQGGSDDLGPGFGPLRAVLIGRAFHWMDREQTLARLDGIVAADGAVVLFADERPDVADNAWLQPFRTMLARYAGEGEPVRSESGLQPHLSVLLDSRFCALEERGVVRRRTVTADQLVDYALSMSSTSPGRLGARTADLAADISRWALDACPAGGFREVLISKALIARRDPRSLQS